MARLDRKTQKVFASAAANNGQFGSAQLGTKVLSNDITVLQALAAYLNGWNDATIGSKKFPTLEEFQALSYIETRQIAYIFQEGIVEYDSGTTYYQKSVVKQTGTYQLYGSITDNNAGNSLADPTKWLALIDLSALVADASETVKGILEIATAAETKTGIDDTRAITPLKLKPYGPQTGDGKDHWTSTLQTGWVWADGNTIGNASSNATNRANADTVDLFTAFWNDYPYSGTTANPALGQLQVFNSSGVAVARGASAAADYAANRTIAMIDKRGRASFGKDNMGGTPAGRLSGQPFGINGLVLGATGGQENHQLTVAELASHDHSTWNNQDTGSDFGFATNNDSVNGPLRTGSTGGDQPHNTVPPGLVCNYVIKL